MIEPKTHDADVIIIGAGPAGLSLANLLGLQGVSVLLLEQLDHLIDYPRAVGIDDEALRSLQTMGIVDKAMPYVTPSHIMRLVNGKGGLITEIKPQTNEFGWSRRNAFTQPDVDRVLYEGLERFPHVEVRFGQRAINIADKGNYVTVETVDTEGAHHHYTAEYVVGAEGGKSPTRKHLEGMGVTFEGESPPTRWLVIDVENDPLSSPNIYLGGDPKRPYVSLGLPLGIRRFEFMLFDDEPDDAADNPDFMDALLRDHVPNPRALDIIRARVYTHHSRVASDFRRGRIMIVGDAAHLMPVWQGQGWNSGQRDATNLAWKLGAVINGTATDKLLDTYHQERHAHAKAMVDLSTAFGQVVKPTNPAVVAVRDMAAKVLNRVPAIRDYFAQMRYKPMPYYKAGAVVDSSTLTAGTATKKLTNPLHTFRASPDKKSSVGSQFIQPQVLTAAGETMLLDDALGYGWSIIQWGGNPERLFTGEERLLAAKLGAKLVSVRPVSQMSVDLPNDPDAIVLGDQTGALKRWFDDRPEAVIFLRPDRFVGAASVAQQAGDALRALTDAVSISPDAPLRSAAATAEGLSEKETAR